MLQAFLCSVVCRERQGLILYDNNDKLVEKKNHISELDAHFKRTCVKSTWDTTDNIDFSKKVKFHSLTLAVFTAQSFILTKKKAWQSPFFLTFFSKTVARKLEHIETV